MFKWVYRLSDGLFLWGGPCEQNYDPATQGVVVLARHPKPRIDRYDGAGGIRAATAGEVSAYDLEQLQTATAREFDDRKDLKAALIWIAQKLNIPLATARAEYLAIRRSL